MQVDIALRRAMRRNRRIYRDRTDPFAFPVNHLLKYFRFPRHELIYWCTTTTWTSYKNIPCCAMPFASFNCISVLCKWLITECVGRHIQSNSGVCQQDNQPSDRSAVYVTISLMEVKMHRDKQTMELLDHMKISHPSLFHLKKNLIKPNLT